MELDLTVDNPSFSELQDKPRIIWLVQSLRVGGEQAQVSSGRLGLASALPNTFSYQIRAASELFISLLSPSVSSAFSAVK